jgi:IclR family pca regulon transcriptional regulator
VTTERGAIQSDERSGRFVQSLERGLAVLRAFDADHPELTTSDVARITGLDRAAARRFLHTLVELGYMRSDGRLFTLRPKVLELGYAYLSSLDLTGLAIPHMKALAARVHESAYLSILDSAETVCVAHVPVRRIWAATITVGTRLPAHAAGSGRVLLADLPDDQLDAYLAGLELRSITPHTIVDKRFLREELVSVRERGWAGIDQELELGLRVFAAPVHDRGRAIAAVSVSTLAGGSTMTATQQLLLPAVLEAAQAISVDLAATRLGR